MDSTQTFSRVESKYLCSPRQVELLREVFDEKMVPDIYQLERGSYPVASVYFDTPERSLTLGSTNKNFTQKLRLRSYGVPQEGDDVFIEIKRKLDDLTYKRRERLTVPEGCDILAGVLPASRSSVVLREVSQLYRRYPEMAPALFVSYNRQAYTAKENSELRISMDQDIRVRDTRLNLLYPPSGVKLLADGWKLMEVKSINVVPVWLGRLLSEIKLFPTSFSKARKGFEYFSRAMEDERESQKGEKLVV